MKKWILPLGYVISTSVFATVPMLEIKDFNFNYTSPRGKGTAENFVFSLKRTSPLAPSQVDVEKLGSDFKFKVSGTINDEFEFKNAPDLLLDAQTIQLKKFHFLFLNKLESSAESASFISPEQDLRLSRFFLSCVKAADDSDLQNQVINGCLKQLSLSTLKISSKSFYENNIVSSLVKTLGNSLGFDVDVENVDLKVNNGKYELGAMLRAQVSGKVKSSGSSSYDTSKKILAIKINEVKFSFLDITDQVFDELKKNESEKMTVKKPYVYLNLSK
jgi:hypothetical protein